MLHLPKTARIKDLVKAIRSIVLGSGGINLESPSLETQKRKSKEALNTISIFLASSMELKTDRNQIEIWVNRENKKLVRKGIFLKLNLWEDFLDAMSPTRFQDEYNKAVLDSEVVICLFATKIGDFTKEEFQVAFNSFKAGNKPHYL